MNWQTEAPVVPGWYWVKVKKRQIPEYLAICDWAYLQHWFRCHSRFEIIAVAGPIQEPVESRDETGAGRG